MTKWSAENLLKSLWMSWKRVRYFQPSSKDIFLASYPRSGNTWMRAILGALVADGPVESIAELDCIIPEDVVEVRNSHLMDRPFQFVKTHTPFSLGNHCHSSARGIIYLIRDPRDIVLSHYRYHYHLYGYRDSLSDFADDWLAGRVYPGAWNHHVMSWTVPTKRSPKRLFVFRYEDLVADCFSEIVRMRNTFNLHYSDAQIQKAVDQASLIQMRKKEASGMRTRERAKGFKFIGAPASDGIDEEENIVVRTKIEAECGFMMKSFGYVPS